MQVVWVVLHGSFIFPGKTQVSGAGLCGEVGTECRADSPSQRGFSQPCPLWHGQCTVYGSPQYPRFCGTYKCQLLKKLIDETTPLPEALAAVQEARGMISELEVLLPGETNPNFRERLAAYLESPADRAGQESTDLDLRRQKAEALLGVYEKVFGVTDVVDPPGME